MRLSCWVLLLSCFIGSVEYRVLAEPLPQIVGARMNKAGGGTTLASFKSKFLNQQVVVKDVPFQDEYCLEWTRAKQTSDGSYARSEDIYRHLPITFRGRKAQIVAIQLAPSILQSTRVGTPNAFGEEADESAISDPYMDVFVRFDDGTLAAVRGYPITLVPEKFELASMRDALQQTIESALPATVGRKLYAVGFSRLYKPTATVAEMSGRGEILSRLSLTEIPILEPLTITKAKYLPDEGAVIFKLQLPSGAEAIAFTPSQFIELKKEQKDILSEISGSLLVSLPSSLTPREIKAIKDMSIFRGMSETALEYSLGFKDSENDWGRGGRQLIYYNGKLIVYVDNAGKVVEWQRFD